jgi:NAD(P)-dependent dehydrogenase (short-subunit alcohol dehydrogenase family)
MDELAGRVAVITGAGSGLGAAIAAALAGAGMRVAALDIDGTAAEATAARVRAAGGDAIARRVDVASRDGLAEAGEAVRDAFGRCDLLFANVGVQQFGAIERLTPEDWQWVLSVNVLGVVQTVEAFLPLLRATGGDRRIVVTSSSSFFVPSVRLGAYVTSKYAVVGYAEVLRQELAAEGIGVTIVFPAGMSTRHLESSARARPENLGPSVTAPDDIEAILSSGGSGSADVVTPEVAVEGLLADLVAGEPYFLTHGSYRAAHRARLAALDRAFDRMENRGSET